MFNTVPIGAATSAVDAPAVGDFCLLKSQKEYGCVFAINPCSIVKFVKPNRNSTEGKNAIQAFVAEALQQLSEMNHCEQGSGLWADVFQDVACVQLHDDASMMLACPKNLPGCRIQRRGSLGCILQS